MHPGNFIGILFCSINTLNMSNTKLFDTKGIHILHLNIRSQFCKNKFDIFKQQMMESGTDIICLSETWLKRNLFSNFVNIPNYNLTRGGLIIYVGWRPY